MSAAGENGDFFYTADQTPTFRGNYLAWCSSIWSRGDIYAWSPVGCEPSDKDLVGIAAVLFGVFSFLYLSIH